MRVRTIDSLRGLASFAVCWFHLTNKETPLQLPEYLRYSGNYGWLGVEVFFVISGFIIPFSLWRASYQLKDFPRFLYKRVIRIDPPYLASILLVLVLAYLSYLIPGYQGEKPVYSTLQVLLHLGYMNVFFGYKWLNVVYWTLAIEFQYYLLIGLTFPLLISWNDKLKLGYFMALGMLSIIIPGRPFVFSWLFLFMFGLLVFQYKADLLTKRAHLGWLVLVTVGAAYTMGSLVAAIGLATALVISFVQLENVLLLALGEVSFSLYLVHVPISAKVINLGRRFSPGPIGQVVLLFIALIASLLAAYVLYRLVEKPAQKWASRINYADIVLKPKASIVV